MTQAATTSKFDLNMHTARLLMDEPFFAAISRRIDKRASTALPTAGVMVNPKTSQFELLYNPEFFEKLTDDERRDVLKHEYYHIVFLHVTSRLPAGVHMKLWNIATDLAINSHLYNLPEGGLIPGEGAFESLPRGKSAEWYLAQLPEVVKSSPNPEGSEDSDSGGESQGGSSEGDLPDTLDDHSGWGECTQEAKDMARERLKDIVRKAADECSKSSNWGSVSASVKQEIIKTLQSKVCWKKLLRYFVKTSQRANRSGSMKRINRRYPYIHPGRKTNRVAQVAISIDQSGSVDNEMLSMFFAELNKLAEIAEFTVIPFDTRVDENLVYVWKKGMKKKWERVMCGGTDFNPPTEYVNQRGFDGHIILTDLCAPKPKSSKCQRMWMTTPYFAERPYFETKEKIVAISDK